MIQVYVVTVEMIPVIDIVNYHNFLCTRLQSTKTGEYQLHTDMRKYHMICQPTGTNQYVPVSINAGKRLALEERDT